MANMYDMNGLSIIRCFGVREKRGEYSKLHEDDTITPKRSSVGFFELFRYADRIDRILIFVGICCGIIDACCFTGIFILFGQLTGTFIEHTFSDSCSVKKQNLSIFDIGEPQCQLGINLVSTNSAHIQKLCSNMSQLSTPNLPLTPAFRMQAMTHIYWLLGICTIEFIFVFMEYLIFSTTAHRQISRMGVHLLDSLIHRVC
ncbi:unnamed protein product [Rotaria magnacalcarata]|uniref:Uncharacterized protein n=2 Tax=Rotaria magnacalcarata TaxID=392030 RepID=A0A820BJZ6_9BILA|nr:unnamed protein product [Rotaria magnacalcarata]